MEQARDLGKAVLADFWLIKYQVSKDTTIKPTESTNLGP